MLTKGPVARELTSSLKTGVIDLVVLALADVSNSKIA